MNRAKITAIPVARTEPWNRTARCITPLQEDDRRVLAAWAADCAERTLSLFEVQAGGSVARESMRSRGLHYGARGDHGDEDGCRMTMQRRGRQHRLRCSHRHASAIGR